VFLGATLSSETTAATTGKVGVLRRDPMAMLPFAGYNMGDYFAHWLDVGHKLSTPPHIFRVNWFRTGENGKFLWPGYGDNIRVLEWVVKRCEGKGEAVDTPIGFVPTKQALDTKGLDLSEDALAQLLRVDPAEWAEAVHSQEEFFASFGSRLPHDLREEHDVLSRRIQDAMTPPEMRGRDAGA
jgi:phosphoenolpyruvate carboxykinase (GTP)